MRIAIMGLAAPLLLAGQAVPEARIDNGIVTEDAHWSAQVPAQWNGTLLLWSRGYSPSANGADAAPSAHRQALLDAGYAIVGSDYGSGGWALKEAIPAQRAAITAFAEKFGKPRRVIGWGFSMGGLVTTALAEQKPSALDGAVSFCSSMGGAVGMMNMALDGTFVFRTLVAPDAGIELVDVTDDRANGVRAQKALDAAMATPEGRARVALAAILAGLPGWTTQDGAEPAADDMEAQVAEMAKTFVLGVMLPRQDQEKRAGGVFSWNEGVDYGAQLRLSGRRAQVESLYRKAGLSLDADLAKLGKTKRISADSTAVDYMKDYYTPTAKPAVPLLAVQAVGDGQTSPSLQRAYFDAAQGSDMRSQWTHSAGHCRFPSSIIVAAVNQMQARLESGHWPTPSGQFVKHRPAPMLRPCIRGKACR